MVSRSTFPLTRLDPGLRSCRTAWELRQGRAGTRHDRGFGELSRATSRAADRRAALRASGQSRSPDGVRRDRRARSHERVRRAARQFHPRGRRGRSAALAHDVTDDRDELANAEARQVSRKASGDSARTRCFGDRRGFDRWTLRRSHSQRTRSLARAAHHRVAAEHLHAAVRTGFEGRSGGTVRSAAQARRSTPGSTRLVGVVVSRTWTRGHCVAGPLRHATGP